MVTTQKLFLLNEVDQISNHLNKGHLGRHAIVSVHFFFLYYYVV